jgi:hypothetical protein
VKIIIIGVPVNGAEFLDLASRSKAAGATIPAYVRSQCGLSLSPVRSQEAAGRTSTIRPVTRALERRNVNVRLTEEEHAALKEQTAAAGVWSIAQYIRTRCGLQVRSSSQPNTPERDREEDDAVERLERLGLNVDEYMEY